MAQLPRERHRVLVVSNLFPPHVLGGAEIVAYRQAVQLTKRGYDVPVFAGWPAPPESAGGLEMETVGGLRVYRVPLTSFEPDDNFFSAAVAKRFYAVLNAERPEIVHFHNVVGLGFSLITAAHRSGARVLVTLHDHAGYCFRATALREDGSICSDTEACASACRGAIRPRDVHRDLPMRLRRDYVAWALEHADRLISPSASLAEAYITAKVADPTRIVTVSNGIDLEPFEHVGSRQADADSVKFFCAAYLGMHKGIPDLLDAAATLAEQGDFKGRWSLAIAGDGDLREKIESEILGGRFDGAVTLLGRVPRGRIIEELELADVVVLPSRWPENEPVVLLEAMAAGRAQLATRIGGMPDIVQDGVTGTLTEPSNAAALAEAMRSYVLDPSLARRQGNASRARRELHSELAGVDQLEAIYHEICTVPQAIRPTKPLVLCTGDWPLPHVAEMINVLHDVHPPPGIRIVWHEWVNIDAWHNATLLWNWSPGAQQDTMRRALRAGVPILAPSNCSLARGIEIVFGAAITYDTFLEGLTALTELAHEPATLKAMRERTCCAAEFIASATASAHYALSAESLAA